MQFQIDLIRKRKRATIFAPLVSEASNTLSPLPINFAFFSRVNLREFHAFVVKENLHLVKQKIVRIGIGNVQAEMVDKLFLFIKPFLPAIGANLLTDFLSEFGRHGRVAERRGFSFAFGAFKFIT